VQEQVEEKTVSLVVQSTKFTARQFQRAVAKLLAEMKRQQQMKKHKKMETPHGKQTVKELVGQNAGVSNVEITDGNIRSFDRVARKYGVDYALQKDASVDPPKWLVFFKARDADVLMAAFKEYTAMKIKKNEKPSVVDELNKNIEKIKTQVVDKEKTVRRGQLEL
jgi:hypothetical protein